MPDAAPAATAPAEAAVPGQLAARKHDESKWPPGVTPVQHVRPIKVKSETGRDVYKYVARLRWLPEGVIKKKDSRYDFIPGSFDSPEAAAAALALAQQQLESAGPEAVWPNRPLPTDQKRQKRDAAYWEEKRAASEEKAAEKAAAKAAREAAEAARPKKQRKEKAGPRVTVALPRDASQVRNPAMRAFLQPMGANAASAQDAVPAWAQPPPVQPPPVPVAPGLAAM